MRNWKVFQMNDCEWWAGASLDAIIAMMKKDGCWDERIQSESGDPIEISPERMNTLIFTDTEKNPAEQRTFAEEFARMKDEWKNRLNIPDAVLFASTEY